LLQKHFNGMDIKTLSAIIGHNSAETTLNVYTHITDEMQKSAAKKIGQNLRRDTSLSNKVNATMGLYVVVKNELRK